MADFKELIDHALARVPDATKVSVILDGQGKVTIERIVTEVEHRGEPRAIAAQPEKAGAQSAPLQSSSTIGGQAVKAPLVGMFYTAPGPDAAPFVTVGSKVKKGDTLCIIEAMKLMNEIESTLDGTVAAILAENGAMVEYGQPLFDIAP